MGAQGQQLEFAPRTAEPPPKWSLKLKPARGPWKRMLSSIVFWQLTCMHPTAHDMTREHTAAYISTRQHTIAHGMD